MPCLFDDAANPHAPCQLGVFGVGDVVLHNVAAEPVAKVDVLVVQRDEDVGDEGGKLWQHPALHVHPGLLDDHRVLPLTGVGRVLVGVWTDGIAAVHPPW